MKNRESWKPSSFILKNGKYVPNLAAIYPGSIHVASLQSEIYFTLFSNYCSGKMLDCGCGKVPYFEMLSKNVHQHYCVDYSNNPDVLNLLDEQIDLNSDFQLKEQNFDSILLSDVVAHIQDTEALMKKLAEHLKPQGVIVLTTPFVYWMSEYPVEFVHPTEFALRRWCERAGLEVEYLVSYGGYADVLLDTLNKGMTGKLSNRLFRLLASVVKKTSWYKNKNEKTKYSYPLGYALVARKT